MQRGEFVNISPLDIRKHEFRKVIRGFDPDEVTTFLDMISIEYESLIRESALLTEKTSNLDNQLKKYRDIESTLRETLLSAQRVREDTISTAKKQSDVIIREAEVKAASIIEEGRTVLSKLRNSLIELKIQKDSYLTKIKALTRAQLDILDQFSFSEEEKIEKIEYILEDAAAEKPEPRKTATQSKDTDAPLSRDTFFPENDT